MTRLEATKSNKTMPNELYESDEFGQQTYAFSPEQFKEEIKNSIESGFSKNFNPEPRRIWDLVDGCTYESGEEIADFEWNESQCTYQPSTGWLGL